MSTTLHQTPPVASPRSDRHVVVRTGRPNHRAVIGGLLVAASALALIGLGEASRPDAPRSWLVVTESVARGQVLEPRHLGLAPMSLVPATEARATTDPDAIVGKVALVELSAGDLIQAGMVGDAATSAGGDARRVGLALEPPDALNGELHTGARVDIITVDDEGQPRTIATDASVSGIGHDEDAGVGGSGGRVRLTVELQDRATAELVVAAAARDEVTLVAGGS